MYTASALRKSNIAEYLLYMWQVEDLIRANSLDLDTIREKVVNAVPELDDERRHRLLEWYESLIDMMRREEIQKKGHLQQNRNVIGRLAELHHELLHDPKETDYQAAFNAALPIIVELRAKAGTEPAGEVETCFNALYGLLMLRLSGREVSRDTVAAMERISRLIALLAKKFHEEEAAEQERLG